MTAVSCYNIPGVYVVEYVSESQLEANGAETCATERRNPELRHRPCSFQSRWASDLRVVMCHHCVMHVKDPGQGPVQHLLPFWCPERRHQMLNRWLTNIPPPKHIEKHNYHNTRCSYIFRFRHSFFGLFQASEPRIARARGCKRLRNGSLRFIQKTKRRTRGKRLHRDLVEIKKDKRSSD